MVSSSVNLLLHFISSGVEARLDDPHNRVRIGLMLTPHTLLGFSGPSTLEWIPSLVGNIDDCDGCDALNS